MGNWTIKVSNRGNKQARFLNWYLGLYGESAEESVETTTTTALSTSTAVSSTQAATSTILAATPTPSNKQDNSTTTPPMEKLVGGSGALVFFGLVGFVGVVGFGFYLYRKSAAGSREIYKELGDEDVFGEDVLFEDDQGEGDVILLTPQGSSREI